MRELKNYTAQLIKLELYKKNHSKIFSDLENLESLYEEAKEVLRNAIKKTKKDVENDVVSVSYVPKYNKFFDYETFISSADKKEIQALQKANGIKHELNKEVFIECVKQGLITIETKQAAYREKELAPMILIKLKK